MDHARFQNRFESKYPEFKLLSTFLGIEQTIEFEHICGMKYEKIAKTALYKNLVCKHCEFKKEFEEKWKEFEVLSSYTSSEDIIEIKHKICERVFRKKAVEAMHSLLCRECEGNKRSEQYIIETFHQKYGEEFELISKFEGRNEPIRVRHKPCGYESKLKRAIFLLEAVGCRKCANNESRESGKRRFMEFFEKNRNEEYELLTSYESALRKLIVRHKKCGICFPVTPNTLQKQPVCRFCNQQKKQVEEKRDPRGLKKETAREFEQRLQEKHGKEFVLGSKYEGYNEIIRILHIPCQTFIEKRGYDAIRRLKCAHCEKLKKISKNEEFKKEFQEKYKDRFELLSEYEARNKPIQFKCKTCNNESEVKNAYMFLKNPSCKHCQAIKRNEIGRENFMKKFAEKRQDYELLSEYASSHEDVTVKHLKCNQEFNVKAYAIIQRAVCRFCYEKNTWKGKNKRKTLEEVKSFLAKYKNGEFSLANEDEYETTRSVMKFIHQPCGRIIESQISRFLQSGGCQICAKKGINRMTEERFTKKVREKYGEKYEIVSKFIDLNSPLTYKRIECGHINEIKQAKNLFKNTNCKQCKYRS